MTESSVLLITKEMHTKTTRVITSHPVRWLLSKNQKEVSAGEDVDKLKP
jgi:hypothetical protein